jgi:hypothetical protein
LQSAQAEGVRRVISRWIRVQWPRLDLVSYRIGTHRGSSIRPSMDTIQWIEEGGGRPLLILTVQIASIGRYASPRTLLKHRRHTNQGRRCHCRSMRPRRWSPLNSNPNAAVRNGNSRASRRMLLTAIRRGEPRSPWRTAEAEVR